MNNILDKTYHLIAQLQVEEKEKENYRSIAIKYFKECGCTMGGLYLIIGLLISILYCLYSDPNFLFSLKGVLFIFLFAVFGKLFGIGIAQIKLFFLFKSIKKRSNL